MPYLTFRDIVLEHIKWQTEIMQLQRVKLEDGIRGECRVSDIGHSVLWTLPNDEVARYYAAKRGITLEQYWRENRFTAATVVKEHINALAIPEVMYLTAWLNDKSLKRTPSELPAAVECLINVRKQSLRPHQLLVQFHEGDYSTHIIAFRFELGSWERGKDWVGEDIDLVALNKADLGTEASFP